MKPEIIIALDFPTGKKALSFLDLFEGEQLYVKVGMELFYSEGPSIVRAIKAGGHKVFLDLKLHDIPNTVKSSMKVLASRQDVNIDEYEFFEEEVMSMLESG